MSSQPNNLRINHADRRFLGVCAGIADYLDMPVVLVRIIFVISIFTWPTLIVAYFALYFWLDRNLSTEKVYDWFSGSAPTRHLKNLDYRRPLYRNMRHRRIAGVCAGIADYLEVRTCLVRLAAILAAVVLGPYAVLAYAVCWFVMEPNPAPRYSRHSRRASRHQRRQERRMSRQEKRRFRQERRKSRHGLSSSRINTPDDEDLYASETDEYRDRYGEEDDLYDETDSDSLYDPDSVTVNLERSRRARKFRQSTARHSTNEKSLEECADTYYGLESRLRDLEAFITSKKFRLHCEINRI
ncbi:MAG: PspC domain-containing protein [Gammaproteobacteria bacterium]|nr:PspC domain-containing protein [Pseudomonadales bacterium]MCP5346587.1 PspC domain-containing protein [Pseudomonadales bacterium]